MISVIIPTYNREKTIMRALNSVLNQTYKDIEVIIVDDGSIDNTEDIVRSCNDKRIRYVKKNNGGAASARNEGIAMASGEYIAFQDSDDFWYEDKLEKQLNCLISNNADVTFCRLSRDYGSKGNEKWPNIEEKYLSLEEVLNTPLVSTQTVFGKACVIKEIKFADSFPALEDYAFSIDVIKKYKLYYQNEILVDLFLQEDSLTADKKKYIEGYKQILIRYEDDYNRYPTIKAKILEIIAGLEREININDYVRLKEAYKLTKNKKILLKFLLARIGVYSFMIKKDNCN